MTPSFNIKSREYPNYPVPAVSGLVVSQKHVLLIKRNHEPAQGFWSLPGGVIQTGEKPEEALMREVLEECQIRIHVYHLLEVNSRIFKDDSGKIQFHYLLLLYRCTAKKRNGHPESDADALAWREYHDSLAMKLAPGISEIIHKYRHFIIEEAASFE